MLQLGNEIYYRVRLFRSEYEIRSIKLRQITLARLNYIFASDLFSLYNVQRILLIFEKRIKVAPIVTLLLHKNLRLMR